MKTCFKCQRELPLSGFYKHKQMADGHLNKCKECCKKDIHENRAKNIDYYRAYDRARGSRKTNEDTRRYRKNNPVKYAAHIIVGNAVRDGVIAKADSCEICGRGDNLHGHHDDYRYPLDVRWLCPVCHCKWHAENGEGKGI